jgi:hypothetical protein
MNCGILIFAHNNEHVDYVKLSAAAAVSAKKHLKVPITLITDKHSMNYLSSADHGRKSIEVFDQILVNDAGYYDDNRRIVNTNDGNKKVPFNNGDRCIAFDITPYDRTLIIDSDFLISSSELANFWNHKQSFMLSKHSIDMGGNRMGPKDIRISGTGPFINYATTIMFSKNKEAESVFNLAKEIKKKYNHYADLYRFDARIFRNDIVFTIANHMVSGFSTDNSTFLPDIRCFLDRDEIIEIDESGKFKILIRQSDSDQNCLLCSPSGVDLHFMNKQTINDNFYRLLEVMR